MQMKITKVRTEQMLSIETIQLEEGCKRAVAELKGEFPDPRHVERTIGKSSLIMTPSGDIHALLLKDCIDLTLCKDGYRAWTHYSVVPLLPSKIHRETDNKNAVTRRDTDVLHLFCIRRIGVARHKVNINPAIL